MTRFLCMVALAGAVGACGESGTGSDGGAGGECTNSADQAAYEAAGDGNLEDGVANATAIATACPFDEQCSDELLAALGGEGLDDEANQALADCVVVCTGEQVDLSAACLDCYGDAVACAAANCASECAVSGDDPDCVTCRTDNGCDADFSTCSGLVDDGA